MNILLTTGSAGEGKYDLAEGIMVFGRSSSCDVKLVDDEVSGKHARFCVEKNGTVFVEDLGSLNGTRVNKTQLIPNTPQQLFAGDVVEMGGARLKCSDDFSEKSEFGEKPFLPPESPVSGDDQSHAATVAREKTLPGLETGVEDSRQQSSPDNILDANEVSELRTDVTFLPQDMTAAPLSENTLEDLSDLTDQGLVAQEELTWVEDENSSPAVNGNVLGKVASRPAGRKGLSPVNLGIILALALCLITVFAKVFSSQPTRSADKTILTYDVGDFSATRPLNWIAECNSAENWIRMNSKDGKLVILVKSVRNTYFRFCPLWKDPSRLKELLLGFDIITAEDCQSIGLEPGFEISNIETVKLGGGIEGLAYQTTGKTERNVYGQVLLTHDRAISYLSSFPATSRDHVPRVLMQVPEYISLSPPLDASVFPRPEVFVAPLDPTRVFSLAMQQLKGAENVARSSADPASITLAIRLYKEAFAKLSASTLQPAEKDIDPHWELYLRIRKIRRKQLIRTQSIILSEEYRGNREGAAKIARGLYDDAKKAGDNSVMEWAWNKISELKDENSKKSKKMF